MTAKETFSVHKSTFDAFLKELLEWNEKINLTAITEPKDTETKHFIDSLSLLPFIPDGTKTLVDVGSGAGFPGIPLAIARPDLQITLIESVGKKAKFLEHVVEVLKLKNVEVAYARSEDVAKHPDYLASFDVATARAVARLDKLTGFVLPLLKQGGVFLAQKSTSENLDDAKDVLKEFDGQIERVEKIEIKELPDRVVAIIRKIK